MAAGRVWTSQVVVPKKVSAVLGKNVTLECTIEVGTNLTLTQSSWERRLPTGSVTVAVYNPDFGISIPTEFAHRLFFRSPSSHDATIMLRDVGFADIGVYTCKVATFPLGNTQASTTVSVLVEPKVYVSAGSVALIDGGNETVVATCIAERARPPAEVSWESNLFGQSEVQLFDEANGTTSTQVRYLWQPTRHVQGHALTCMVRHPALHTDFRVPYQLNVQFAPDISVVGYDGNWYVGRENVQMTCKANANPPAHHFRWIRLDSEMPEGAEIMNNTLLFLRPLQRNDTGVYRCEAANDIGLRSRDVRILIQGEQSTCEANARSPDCSPSVVCPILMNTISQERRGGNLFRFGTNVHVGLEDIVVDIQQRENNKAEAKGKTVNNELDNNKRDSGGGSAERSTYWRADELMEDPPTMPSTITAPVLTGAASSTLVDDKRQVLLSSPTLEALPESNLGSIVSGAVGGALFLLLLLSLVGVCYLRKQQTFHGNYYTKQYLGPTDLQKAPAEHELHPTKAGSSPRHHDHDHDREEWGDRKRRHHGNHNGEESSSNGYTRAVRESNHHNNHKHHHDHPHYSSPQQTERAGYPPSTKPLANISPYLSDDCDESGPEGDYVSHMDGSVISQQSQQERSNSVAVAGALMGAVLALFLSAVFTIVIFTARKAPPPAFTDKV
ncbi:nectin-3-like protein [Diretmus argenteus]